MNLRVWLALLRPGDWLVVVAAGLVAGLSFPLLWQGGRAELAVIRSGGRIIAEFPLTAARTFQVAGVLGTTTIEIQPGRARIQSDPGPRQYCVKQGWLTRPGALAVCAPNQVSLALTGTRNPYDSLGY